MVNIKIGFLCKITVSETSNQVENVKLMSLLIVFAYKKIAKKIKIC